MIKVVNDRTPLPLMAGGVGFGSKVLNSLSNSSIVAAVNDDAGAGV